ncbi:trifunctional purine biosynthetic protein adenosine-3-like [Leptodactylus fuscus]|uniref:trifunctional purine biosynthetic protein adenosine-3-like n=1 Tax=Leptodactylus fuscus TaxID=238119 RepID=UPI003F4EC814
MADRVLILGSGESEESLCWAVAQSAHVKQVLFAPGSEGMADSEKIDKSAVLTNNPAILKQFCKDHNISLVIISTMSLLTAGLTDDLTRSGVRCFGPTMKAAQLQDNKKISKDFMESLDIPTARWKSFNNPHKACSFITYADFPALVVKAMTSSSGRDTYITKDKDEACRAVQRLTQDWILGAATTLVVEERLEGKEYICLCVTDGVSLAPLPFVHISKHCISESASPGVIQIRRNGAVFALHSLDQAAALAHFLDLPDLRLPDWLVYALPAAQMSEKNSRKIQDNILQKALDAMRQEGWHYKGLFGAKIMMAGRGPLVLGFICTFQDLKSQSCAALGNGIWYHNDSPSPAKNFVTLKAKLILYGSHVVLHPFPQVGPQKMIVPLLKPDLYEVVQAAIEERLSSHVVMWSLEKSLASTTQRPTWSPMVISKKPHPEEGHNNVKPGSDEAATCEVTTVVTKSAKTVTFPGMAYRKDYPSVTQKGKARSQFPFPDETHMTYDPSSHATQSGSSVLANTHQSIGRKVRSFEINPAQFKDPVFVCSSNSVGDKIQVALACNLHRSVAQSLVTTCINELLAQGAQALFFIPQFACGQLSAEVTDAIEEGLASGCRISGATLLEKEVTQPLGLYTGDNYYLSGFALGEMIMDSTMVFGLPVLHSLQSGDISICIPITQGGLVGSILHYLPEHMEIILDALCWKIPAIFTWLYKEGELSEQELVFNFNCGLGAVLIAQKNVAQKILVEIQYDQEAWLIGSVLHHHADSPRVQVRNFLESLTLNNFQLMKNVILYKVPAKISKVAVLISSAGPKLKLMMDTIRHLGSSARLSLIISNKSAMEELKKAAGVGIPTRVIDHTMFGCHSEFESTVCRVLEEFSIDLICLAGSTPFKQILQDAPLIIGLLKGKPVVVKSRVMGLSSSRWKILKLFSSLLPSTKMDKSPVTGAKVHGCTVRFLLDANSPGPIILQETFVAESEVPLANQMEEAEQMAVAKALHLVASGGVTLGSDGCTLWKSGD